MGVPPAVRRATSSASGGTLDQSLTDVGEPSLIRATSLEIARGTVLAGRYQIETVIGKGGSGIVLRAFDRVAQVAVAVKILKPDLAADPRWIERFSRELRLARQIQHPNVCRVFDIGQADGHWFITMELATGGTLRDQLGNKATERPAGEKLADVCAVVAGLAAIHEAGIVHRDVKPDNFLRMADGRLVLSDFGLATHPADAPTVSIMVGTPHYMAPEVVLGEAATQRSDVWSAAVVIHEILVGVRPGRLSGTRPPTPPKSQGATRQESATLAACWLALGDEPDGRPENGDALQRALETSPSWRAKSYTATGRRLGPTIGWGAIAVVVVTASLVLSRRFWQPAEASSREGAKAYREISSIDTPRDWSQGARVVASIDGTVHCFSLLPGGATLRAIWGSPRRAEDVDLSTGARKAS
jgi:serine/threonine protein kinase